MNRKRKPLNDALAQSFVYGTSEPNINEVKPDTTKSFEEQSSDKNKTNNTVRKPQVENRDTINDLPKNKKKKKGLSMIDKLQIKPKEATKRFTVDLPESQHRKLSILAAKTGRTKADIVRMLLEEALEEISD